MLVFSRFFVNGSDRRISFCGSGRLGRDVRNSSTLSLPDTTVTSAQTVTCRSIHSTGRVAWPLAGRDQTIKTSRPSAVFSPRYIRPAIPISASKYGFRSTTGTASSKARQMARGRAISANRRWLLPCAGVRFAATDTGHKGGGASFALGHPEKMLDFQYRAIHEMTLKGQAFTKALYGNDALKYSCLVGRSTGGKQQRHGQRASPAITTPLFRATRQTSPPTWPSSRSVSRSRCIRMRPVKFQLRNIPRSTKPRSTSAMRLTA